MISGLAHVNLTVPTGSLDAAHAFYGSTLGLTARPVPALQQGRLAWFDIRPANTGVADGVWQQVHIAFGRDGDFDPSKHSSRHPCFRIENAEALLALQRRIFDHFERGGLGAPREADKPGEEISGSKGVEFPERFFARDYAGNRLEFSL